MQTLDEVRNSKKKKKKRKVEINQVIKIEVKEEIKDETQEEIKDETQDEIKDANKYTIMEEIKDENKAIKEEIMDGIIDEIKEEIKVILSRAPSRHLVKMTPVKMEHECEGALESSWEYVDPIKVRPCDLTRAWTFQDGSRTYISMPLNWHMEQRRRPDKFTEFRCKSRCSTQWSEWVCRDLQSSYSE